MSSAPQKAFTMILYIIPEDHDDVEQPNAFGMHMAQEDIRVSDIESQFPIAGKAETIKEVPVEPKRVQEVSAPLPVVKTVVQPTPKPVNPTQIQTSKAPSLLDDFEDTPKPQIASNQQYSQQSQPSSSQGISLIDEDDLFGLSDLKPLPKKGPTDFSNDLLF